MISRFYGYLDDIFESAAHHTHKMAREFCGYYPTFMQSWRVRFWLYFNGSIFRILYLIFATTTIFVADLLVVLLLDAGERLNAILISHNLACIM